LQCSFRQGTDRYGENYYSIVLSINRNKLNRMMKASKSIKLVLLNLLLIGSNISAQHIGYGCESKEILNLKAATLYIVPTGDRVFDDSLAAAVQKYWKVTPVKALTSPDI
jgi:hypothetical protein